jgi:NAD-specific glutamate dehydrogenase
MAVVIMPRAEEGEAGQTLVEAAASVLAARRSDIPRDFLIELFERAAPDDLVRYSPEELAGIGEQSWSFLLQREAGGAKIAFRPVHSGDSIAVMEILNDDMPFLVDSVLGELGERAADIRLLVHPVFSVERDQAGRLIAFKGMRKGDGHRESFIHIQVVREDDKKSAPISTRARKGAGRRTGRSAGLAVDAGARQRSRRRAESQSAAACGRRDRRSDPVPAMDRRRQFHAARRPRLRLRRHRHRTGAEIRDRAWAPSLARHAASSPRQ